MRSRLTELQNFEDDLHDKVLMMSDTLPRQASAFDYFVEQKHIILDTLDSITHELGTLGRPDKSSKHNFQIDT